MPEDEKVVCPDCGTEMNHHADKLDYGASADGVPSADAAEVIIEAHTCPDCGRSETRQAKD